MSKACATFLLTLVAIIAQGSISHEAPASQADQPTDQKVIRDPGEYNAYIAALNLADPAARAGAMEAFIQHYPQSIVLSDALEQAMASYQATGNVAKVKDMANRILKINPNHVQSLAIVTYLARAGGDAAGVQTARDSCQRGLQVLLHWPKPQALSDADFVKLRDQMSDIFNGACGFVALQDKDNTAAQKYLAEAVRIDPTNMQDMYQLAIAELEMKPMDITGLWHGAKAMNLAENNGQAVQAISIYVKAKYEKYYGNINDWDRFVATVAKQTAPPGNLADSVPLASTALKPDVSAFSNSSATTNSGLESSRDQNQAEAIAWSEKSDDLAKAGDKEGAWRAEARALQLSPDDPLILRDFCHRSFDAARYRDAIWSARELKKKDDWLMSAATMVEWGVSLGVLGDYTQASEVIKEAIHRMDSGTESGRFPRSEWLAYLHEWDITFAYFNGSFDDALAADQDTFASGGEKNKTVFDILAKHVQEVGGIAEKQDMPYAALKSQSYLNKLIREGIEDYYIYGYDEYLRTAGAYNRNLTWKLISWYRSMPIKPVPSSKAIAEYKRALDIIQNQSSSGDFSHDSPWSEAERLLFDVTRRVPWWAEPHCSLAILVKAWHRRPSNNYYDQYAVGTHYIAAQELMYCVGADPNGPQSKAAKKLLIEMKEPIPQ
jgi:hypothetical protein